MMAVTQEEVRKTETGLEDIGDKFHSLCNYVWA